MKKLLSLIAVITVLLIALTGCVNVNYEVTLNKDGTADISYIYGFEKETLEQLGATAEDMTEDMKESAEESEYKIEAYSDDKIEGFKASKHIEDLSKISLEEAFGEENVKDSEENQIKIEKNGSKVTYSQNAKIDLTSMDESTAALVTMKYTVKLPAASKNNNADEVSKDGKTLTWNLKAGEVNEVKFNAESGGNKIITTIVIIVVAVLVVSCIAFVCIKLSKKDKKAEAENDIENKE